MSKPAAIIGCHHTCPLPKHVGGPSIQGSTTVFIEGVGACRQNDPLVCEIGTDAIALGSPTIFINGLQAARLGDPTVHGGQIVKGVNTVFFG